MQTTAHETLAGAVGLGRRELVALVGGGGKTGALRLLARELAAPGRRVVATTTTAMFLRELSEAGPVVMSTVLSDLVAGVQKALAQGAAQGVAVGAAHMPPDREKVTGLPVDWVDRLWAKDAEGRGPSEMVRGAAASTADLPAPLDYLLVEADGSRGRPLKAFGAHEPQVPDATTTVVQVAGLDALGAPLTEKYVHRAGLLASALQVPVGSKITAPVFAGCLREQLRVIRRRWPDARVVALLNKADRPEEQAAGLRVAGELLGAPAANGGDGPQSQRPAAVVVASLKERRFVRARKSVSVAAIVLAAGSGTRMGDQKVLFPLGERSLVQRVVDAAVGSEATETIVVVGHEAGSVAEAVKDRSVNVVVNPDHAEGMSTSLQAGVRAVRPGCEAAVFMLADQPFVTSMLVDRLIERFAESGAWVVRPVLGDRPIHPVLMSAALFPEILSQRGDVGGREIARRHRERVSLLPVDDSRLDLDIDTGEDYEEALRIQGRLAERVAGDL